MSPSLLVSASPGEVVLVPAAIPILVLSSVEVLLFVVLAVTVLDDMFVFSTSLFSTSSSVDVEEVSSAVVKK